MIGTYLCGAKNGKKICYRIFDCREMGVGILEVTVGSLLAMEFSNDDSDGGARGRYFRNFWVGMCRWDPGTLSLYQS